MARKEDAQMHVRINSKLLAAFKAYCEGQQITMSELIKEQIEDLLGIPNWYRDTESVSRDDIY